jgi:hypothetical protein
LPPSRFSNPRNRESFHSYLRSAFYDEAIECLKSAPSQVRSSPDLTDMLHFAQGMSMFQAARYAESLESLGSWENGPVTPGEKDYVALANAAISRIHNLVDDDERDVVAAKAQQLQQRFKDWSGKSASDSDRD